MTKLSYGRKWKWNMSFQPSKECVKPTPVSTFKKHSRDLHVYFEPLTETTPLTANYNVEAQIYFSRTCKVGGESRLLIAY
jgi:hypothetical protein